VVLLAEERIDKGIEVTSWQFSTSAEVDEYINRATSI
jgi:hypothetical protein